MSNLETNIIVVGYVGIKGTEEILIKKKENLLTRFSLNFYKTKFKEIEDIENKTKIINKKILTNLDLIKYDKNQIPAIYEIKKGGFLSTLWDMSIIMNSGLEYELLKIPILQTTIEVSEFFNINPYRLYSEKSYIILTEKKYEYIEFLYDMLSYEVPISIVGKLKKGKSKRRIDSEGMTFLTKDYKDEIDKIILNYTKGKNK